MKTYEQCLEDRIKELEEELDGCVDLHGEKVKACIDYLSIIDIRH